MRIRDFQTTDEAAVASVIAAAFGQPAEADLVAALRRDGDAVFDLVADDDGTIVGHVLASRMVAPGGLLALAPVSVLPQCQWQGVGTALVETVLSRAAADQWAGVVVLGDPAYYGRFGFSAASAARFTSPYPAEYTQAVETTAGALARLSGRLVYPAAFSEVDE